METLSREDNIQVYDTALRYQLALIASVHISEDAFKTGVETAQELFRDLLHAYQPWLRQSSTQAQQSTFDTLMQRYREKCGDPRDPEYMRLLKESIAMRKREREEKKRLKQADQYGSLDRRLAERDRRTRGTSTVRKPRRG